MMTISMWRAGCPVRWPSRSWVAGPEVRSAEGKSRRDAKRCLRRVIARQLFRLLERYDRPGVEVLRAA
jgi:hypothetical protein